MRDLFVLQLTGDGNTGFIAQAGTSADDVGYGIALDGTRALFVTGQTNGQLAATGASVGSDLFVMRFDPDGARQWVRQKGTISYDAGSAIAADSTGSIFVTGNSSADFDGTGPAQYQGGFDDAIIVRYAAEQ